ncbi:EamA family transporter [Cohnella sp. CFH 77786]|uniref:DMT family transporter n=1 Tax=Cohnella sp. CFH 77786 TaxID=2662265 RepID=UPI001C60ADC1|nr:EamA family transporter [Cohnella sp. CFH 77786]MBW5448862.1 EamA family transporter [Cohnella sp. CFH 77786]
MILFNYLLMCIIFGTTFLAIKIGVDASASPFFLAGLRFFLAGLILLGWTVWRHKTRLTLLLRKEMLVTGFCLTFATFATLYWAEQHVSSGIAAVLSAAGPLMILLLQAAFMRQKTSAVAMVGCVAGFAGVFLIVLPKLTVSAGIWWAIGSALILLGEFCYSAGALYTKRVTDRFRQESPVAMNAVQMLYGGAMLLVLSAFTEQVSAGSLFSANAIGSLLYLTVAGSMIGHTLFYWLVAKTNPVFPSTWLYVSPLIALVIGVLFYRETFTWLTGVGVAIILAGNFLINWSSLSRLFRKPKAAVAQA